MSDEDRAFVESLKTEARRYRSEGRGFGSLGMWARDALRSWKSGRPRMYARLKRLRVLKLQAMIAEQRFLNVKEQFIRGGMNPWDAGNEAAYSLMLTPEDDEEIGDAPVERKIAEVEMLEPEVDGETTDATPSLAANLCGGPRLIQSHNSIRTFLVDLFTMPICLILSVIAGAIAAGLAHEIAIRVLLVAMVFAVVGVTVVLPTWGLLTATAWIGEKLSLWTSPNYERLGRVAGGFGATLAVAASLVLLIRSFMDWPARLRVLWPY